MKSIVKGSLLTLTLAGGFLFGTVSLAEPGQQPDPSAMVQRHTEKLGLEDATAEIVASTLLDARKQKQALRTEAKEQVKSLHTAVESGNKKGMISAMNSLEDIKDELDSLKEETASTVKSYLTVEQQAKMTLHHIHKRHRKKQRARDRQQR